MEKREEEEECDNKTFKKTKPAKRNEEDITICEISKNRRVVVRSWKGMVMVDIREFYMKDGDLLPGKMGISFPLDQWNILRDQVGEIDKALAENP
ncbi:hypothetical protein AAC387_Pa11g1863 [Persea americana]